MPYLSEKKSKTKLEKQKKKNSSKNLHQKLTEEKNKYKTKKLPSTSKLVLIGAVILCLEIIIFAEYAMIKMEDLSGLYAIVGIAATLATVVLGYFVKSKAENTVGGIVYETALQSLTEEQELGFDETEDSDEALG